MTKSNEKLRGLKLLYSLPKYEKGRIAQLAWSPDGKYMSCCYVNGVIEVWDRKNGLLIKTIKKSFHGRILCLEWSPDGIFLALGGSEKIIQILDINTGNLYSYLKGHRDWIRDLSWSPNGEKIASCSSDQTVKIWDLETKNIICSLEGHKNWVKGVAWSQNSELVVSGSDDSDVIFWDTKKGNVSAIHRGKSSINSSVLDVVWSQEGTKVFAALSSGIINIINLKGEKIQVLEGHRDQVVALAVSPDNNFLISASEDNTIRFWRCDTYETVAILPISMLKRASYGLKFHPKRSLLAAFDRNNTLVNLWEIDTQILLSSPSISDFNHSSIHYTNAKIVLLGESGVGKSGLGIRIAEKIFRETKSTHGAQFWQIPLPKDTFSANQLEDNVQAEITLWDLAGQPDYHLIHQLFLDDIDIALLLFDCSNTADPFRGVPYWAKVLKKQTPKKALKYLISSRCDVSPVTVDQREINSKLVVYELDDYFCTSAFTGQGIKELLQHILNNIPWDRLPRTSTPKLFQITREYLLEQKEVGKSLLTLEEIRTEVIQRCDTGKIINDGEIETVKT